MKSSVSPSAVRHIENKFSGLRTTPEDIIRMIPRCEERSINFVFGFFGKPVPRISVEYITTADAGPEHKNNYGIADEGFMKLLVDNMFPRILGHVHPLDAQFEGFVIHEATHVHDILHTGIREKINEVLAELATFKKPQRLRDFLRKKNPRISELNEIHYGLYAIREGRAVRLEIINMADRFKNDKHFVETDAMFYVKNTNKWYYDCSYAVAALENEFGFSAWKLSEKFPPISYEEVQMPHIYVQRLKGMQV